jgi:hypothetical protein
MGLQGHVNLEMDLDFTDAGVGFTVKVREENAAGSGPTLHVELHALGPHQTARFTESCSHALGDFVGGFCRWLGTKAVTVNHTEQDISGHFKPDHTIFEQLAIVQELCQMLNDKFGLYPDSILQ